MTNRDEDRRSTLIEVAPRVADDLLWLHAGAVGIGQERVAVQLIERVAATKSDLVGARHGSSLPSGEGAAVVQVNKGRLSGRAWYPRAIVRGDAARRDGARAHRRSNTLGDPGVLFARQGRAGGAPAKLHVSGDAGIPSKLRVRPLGGWQVKTVRFAPFGVLVAPTLPRDYQGEDVFAGDAGGDRTGGFERVCGEAAIPCRGIAGERAAPAQKLALREVR
ncbi:MAG: hypothetical protein EBR30_27790 [Cytophagia bacterium]|nr:hypothetical protein [Cytophagia bacterium]